ncbi:MAG: elongation factor G [Planctomycetes bacterium]|nr:elongation factor G [Planctomycetota bacterium]
MPKYETKDIRTLAFVGHGDSGKTSFVDAALFRGGVNSRLGKIEDGTSLSDFDPDERERKHSIDLSVVHTAWKGRELILLDAPGYSDFVGEAISALGAVETAVVCVNAASGVLVNTRKLWDYAGRAGTARFVLCNKMDLENVDWDGLTAAIRESLSDRCRIALAPIGQGPTFKGVVSVLDPPADLPSDLKEKVESLRGELVESVVEVDDAVMERYLNGEQIGPEELDRLLTKAIATGRVVPILACAARLEKGGLEQALDFLARYAPSPLDVPARKAREVKGDAEVERGARGDAPFSAQVFKCLADPFVGRLSYFRVWSGALAADSQVFLPKVGSSERVAKVFRMQGKEQQPTDRVVAGDIAVVAKLENVAISDTLCDAGAPVKFAPLVFPKPMAALAVEPKSRTDEQRIGPSLAKMAESDPLFRVSHDAQTAEIVVHGSSSLHLDIALGRLKRKFDVSVTTHPPKIPYRETIGAKAEGNYKHKKQTGGHGQYGDVYLRIEPAARGTGFEFADEIKGGVIPQQYVPAVEKGVKETMERGVLAGCPVVDIRVAVYFGSYHDVDSSEAAFKIAAREAFKIAFSQARPCLLEPVMNITVTVPTRFMGDLTGFLNTKRGRIVGMDSLGVIQEVKATIPLAEIANFSTELRSMTQGEGSYDVEFSHYDVVPAKIAETIIARARAARSEEKEE